MSESFDDQLAELTKQLRAERQEKNKPDENQTQEQENENASVGDLYFGGSSGIPTRPSSSGSAGLTPAQISKELFLRFDDPNEFTGNNGGKFKGPKSSKPRTFRMDLIGFCEEFYHENFRMPTPKELQMRFRGRKECPRFLEDWPERIIEIREPLELRGIDIEQSPVGDLDPRFVSAVHLILNYNDKRTIPAKLKQLEISTATWQAWLKKPNYKSYYRKHGDAIFNDEFHAEAQRNLMVAASSGDLQALKFYYEVSGAYRPQESATQNVISTLMVGLFEVLAKHIPAELIAQIGAEIREQDAIKKVMGVIEVETNSDFQERKLALGP